MDRFTRGFVAGIIGGIIMNVYSFSAYAMNLTETKFNDWTGMIIYSRIPDTIPEIILALIIHLIFTGTLGIAFAYLIPGITSERYILKAIVFSTIAGFVIYAIPTLFKTPNLYYKAFKTVLSNFIGGLIWGLSMVIALRWLDNNPKVR